MAPRKTTATGTQEWPGPARPARGRSLCRERWLRTELTIPPSPPAGLPGLTLYPPADPPDTNQPVCTAFLPRLCATADGALLVNVARSPVFPRYDSTAGTTNFAHCTERVSGRSPSLSSLSAASDSTIPVAATTESNGHRRPTVTAIGDDERLGFPGVGMQCWLGQVALVEVEDNANVTLSDVRKEARRV